MANNYKGYLLKFGGSILPNKYFLEYSSTPDQRIESSAERDNLGTLHRATLPNGKTSITFSTHIMSLDEKIQFQSIINSAMVFESQRKVSVTYWNDETNTYKTGYFYIPDIEYQAMDADADTIRYNPITVELITRDLVFDLLITSKSLKNKLLNNCIHREIIIRFPDDDIADITGSNIVEDSFELTQSLFEGSEFKLGGGVASQLVVQVIDIENELNNKRINVFLSCTYLSDILYPSETLYPRSTLYSGRTENNYEIQLFSGTVDSSLRQRNRQIKE